MSAEETVSIHFSVREFLFYNYRKKVKTLLIAGLSLVIGGIGVVIVYTIYKLITQPDVPILLKAATVVTVVGGLLLLTAAVIERIKHYKTKKEIEETEP